MISPCIALSPNVIGLVALFISVLPSLRVRVNVVFAVQLISPKTMV